MAPTKGLTSFTLFEILINSLLFDRKYSFIWSLFKSVSSLSLKKASLSLGSMNES